MGCVLEDITVKKWLSSGTGSACSRVFMYNVPVAFKLCVKSFNAVFLKLIYFAPFLCFFFRPYPMYA